MTKQQSDRAGRPCPFCRIAAGEEPAHLILDEPEVVAFLDRRPLFKGHTLVIPRGHVDTLADCPPATMPVLMAAVQRLAGVIPAAVGADGTFVAMNNVVSQSVPHLHVHVVPRRRGDGLRGFFWPRVRYASDAEAEEYAVRIRAAL